LKYLIEKQKINVNHVDNSGNNGIILPCMSGENIEVVKYLVQKRKMNVNHNNNDGDKIFD
jgi:hypothetical protein